METIVALGLTLGAGKTLGVLVALGLVGALGMSWLTSEPIITLLQSVGLAGPTGLLAPSRRVLAKTVDYTVVGDEGCGTVFTTRGAAGAVIFTLPTAQARFAGLWFRFKNVVDLNMTVVGAPADTLIVDGDLTADSLAVSTAAHKIGGEIEAFCDGTSWFASGVNVGVTYTVAT